MLSFLLPAGEVMGRELWVCSVQRKKAGHQSGQGDKWKRCNWEEANS